MTEGSAPHPEPYSPPRTSGLAIAALACGIAGLTVFPILASLAAVVLGIMARDEIRRDPAVGGEGMATAGLVLGWIGVALAALAILFVLGVFVLFVV